MSVPGGGLPKEGGGRGAKKGGVDKKEAMPQFITVTASDS